MARAMLDGDADPARAGRRSKVRPVHVAKRKRRPSVWPGLAWLNDGSDEIHGPERRSCIPARPTRHAYHEYAVAPPLPCTFASLNASYGVVCMRRPAQQPSHGTSWPRLSTSTLDSDPLISGVGSRTMTMGFTLYSAFDPQEPLQHVSEEWAMVLDSDCTALVPASSSSFLHR